MHFDLLHRVWDGTPGRATMSRMSKVFQGLSPQAEELEYHRTGVRAEESWIGVVLPPEEESSLGQKASRPGMFSICAGLSFTRACRKPSLCLFPPLLDARRV